MDLIDDIRVQRAVYWAPTGSDPNAMQEFDDPIELLVRWDDTAEVFMDRSGNQQLSRAVVYVGQKVKELGVMWLSTKMIDDADGSALAELTDEDEPFKNEGAFEIRRYAGIPTIDQDETLRVAYL